jgi:hypothetical protein
VSTAIGAVCFANPTAAEQIKSPGPHCAVRGPNRDAIDVLDRVSCYIALRFSAADLPVLRSTTTSKETR